MVETGFAHNNVQRLVYRILCVYCIAKYVQKTISYIESQTEHHRIVFFDTEIKTMCKHLGLIFHPDDLR